MVYNIDRSQTKAPRFEEIRHGIIKFKLVDKDFSNNFINGITEANGPEVIIGLSILGIRAI